MVNKMLTKSVLRFLNVRKHSRKMFQNVAELFETFQSVPNKMFTQKDPQKIISQKFILFINFFKNSKFV